MRFGTALDAKAPGASMFAFTWSVRTIPFSGSTSEGAMLAALKTSALPFCMNESLRPAAECEAPGNPASR